MNWPIRYANDVGAPDDGLSTMAADLNSHIFSYTGQSGQSPTDRMYKGNKGADLDNQPWFANLLSKYNKSSTGAIGKAVQQIRLFTGKDSYGSDIRTNREKFPEFHKLMDQAGPIAGGLSRGTVLTDIRHGTPGSPIDISQHYKVGDKMTTQVTSSTSDTNLAKSWVLDDKQRFDKAKDTGDNSVLDTKYNGARYGAFVVQHFPAGIKGLQVAPLSAVPEHNEVVLQAGQKLRVSKVTGPDESGVHHVYYEHDTERVASWNKRYAMERTAIALAADPDRLHPEHQRALKMMGGLLNAQHLTFGYDPRETREAWDGRVTDTDPENWRPIDRVEPSTQRPDDWEHAIRPRMDRLRLHPDSIKAFNKINKAIRRQDKYQQVRNPYSDNYDPNKTRKPFAAQAINALLRQVEEQVGGRRDTLHSDAGGGGYQELHYTIEDAPRTQVDLHRGIAISQYSGDYVGDIKGGAENLEHNREELKKFYAPGSTHAMGVQSWSSDTNVARAFSHRVLGKDIDNGGISAIFHLPKSSKALQISGLMGHATSQSQHEYLSAQDNYRVKKHEVDENGIHHIHLEQTGEGSEEVRQQLMDKERAPNDTYATGYERQIVRDQEPMKRHWDNVDRETTKSPGDIISTTQKVKKWREKNPGKIGPSSEELWKQRFEGMPR